MLVIGQVVADELGRDVNREVGDRTLKVSDSGLLLCLDGRMGLLNHAGGFCLRLGGDVGLHVFAGLLGIGDDFGSLNLGLSELLLVLSKHALAFLARFFSVLEVVANGVRALLKHLVEDGPAKLGQDDPQNNEGDEHRNEFAHLRQNGLDATLLGSERIRRARQSESTRGQSHGAELASCLVEMLQLVCLLFFLSNHAVIERD